MVSRAAEKPLTAEEFALLPEAEGGCRMELVDGKVIMTPPPGVAHGAQANEIIWALNGFARQHRLGRVVPESGFVLAREPALVRAPDVAFVARERLGDGPPLGYFEGGPTLAVEVVPPSNTQKAVLEKVAEYLDAGAERVWVVRPRTRSVLVYFAGGEVVTLHSGETLTSEHAGFAVNGFSLPVDEIFA